MDCENCDLKNTEFNETNTYTAFARILDDLISANSLKEIADARTPSKELLVARYDCMSCDETWVLITPSKRFGGSLERIQRPTDD